MEWELWSGNSGVVVEVCNVVGVYRVNSGVVAEGSNVAGVVEREYWSSGRVSNLVGVVDIGWTAPEIASSDAAANYSKWKQATFVRHAPA